MAPARRDPYAIAAVVLAAVAVTLSAPAYVSMRENADAVVVLEGLPYTLYVVALLVGIASVVVAGFLHRRTREAKLAVPRTDLRRLAVTLTGIAIVVWILPFCTMAGSGL